MVERWIAQRARRIEASGIRRFFDLAARLKDPIDLSIGQPCHPVPAAATHAAVSALEEGRNGYAVTQGLAALRDQLVAQVARKYPGAARDLIVTSGTSGALTLAILALVDPGDEVILFDPCFVSYPHLVAMAGGVPVWVDTYDDFRLPLDRVAAALTPRTKLIMVNSPGNPTGAVIAAAEMRGLADLAAAHGVALLSDEVYGSLWYEGPVASPAAWNRDAIVVDGFSKAYGMPGWRLGFVHGPAALVAEMAKLQQYTYVCSPQPLQLGAAAALATPVDEWRDWYRAKRDQLRSGLAGSYEVHGGGGAFYLFPRAPFGTGSEFAAAALREGLVVVPGAVFSRRDSHFRISYAAAPDQLERGAAVLRKLAREGSRG